MVFKSELAGKICKMRTNHIINISIKIIDNNYESHSRQDYFGDSGIMRQRVARILVTAILISFKYKYILSN